MSNQLVSFCVKSYNHAAYVRDALKGAFSQTYRPLEIVISDDNSTDASWSIICEMVDEYRKNGGDARIVLNRNETNLGNLGNWVKVFELSHGELCIKADGDDISYPQRTTKIVEAWVATGKKASTVSHAAYTIDKYGNKIGVLHSSSAKTPCGTVMAWRRDCLTEFSNEFDDPSYYDDDIFARRARMLGDDIVLPDILAEYRIGTGLSTSLFDLQRVQSTCFRKLLQGVAFSLKELDGYKAKLTKEKFDELRNDFLQQAENARTNLALLEGSTFAVRKKALNRLPKVSFFTPIGYQRFAFLVSGRVGKMLIFIYQWAIYHVKRAKYAHIK